MLSSLAISPRHKRLQPESPLHRWMWRVFESIVFPPFLCFPYLLLPTFPVPMASFSPPLLESNHLHQCFISSNTISLGYFFTCLCSSFQLPMRSKWKDLPSILENSRLRQIYHQYREIFFFLFPPLNHRQLKLLLQMQILGRLCIKPVLAINSCELIRLLEISFTISQPLR